MNIAILGGTFDPVHNGHVAVARTVVQAFDIDELHFVPAFTPPHKPGIGITSAFHRFAMVALATSPEDRFRVSAIEADTLGPCYSVDTLDLMHRRYPDSRFLFITGTDMYREIEDWRDYSRLFRLSSMAVVQRPGFAMREDVAPFETLRAGTQTALGKSPSVYHLPWLSQDVSSTRIRETASRDEECDAWVPSTVNAYIRRNRLYTSDR